MSAAKTNDYETILKVVRAWPPAQQFTLVQEVLKTLALDTTPKQPHQPTLDRALGLLATERPTPSDAEIKQWLDERRTERYGQ